MQTLESVVRNGRETQMEFALICPHLSLIQVNGTSEPISVQQQQ